MSKEIPLTQGQVAIVDDEDFAHINQYKWHAQRQRNGRFYAVRLTSTSEGRKLLCMHRVILGLSREDPREVDHKEPPLTLDNRRSNLRIATGSQNHANSLRARNNTSGFKGVVFQHAKPAHYKRWRAVIKVHGKRISLGVYATPEEASAAYKTAASKYHGEFARA
jgi:hypothetical protein